MIDVIDLTKDLIACPSVTPKDAGAQTLLARHLGDLGFACNHLPFGQGAERVENLFAHIGSGDGPHLCFAGHTDVVPAGDESVWTYGPFTPTIADDGKLYGRGASDMKGAVAAFVAAAASYITQHGAPKKGTISLLITGDEEGPAINGTTKVLEWMKENSLCPDMALVGEPTNPDHLGQEIKIGRRGSLNGILTVTGKQGHVAYQKLANNPLPTLARMISTLSEYEFDQGSAYFDPTNLEFSTIDVGNTATNVIPGQGIATFNVRFSDKWTADTLSSKIRDILDSIDTQYSIEFSSNASSFLTEPSDWTQCVQNAVTEVTGKTPAYTTTGGTSDARFITQYCPVIECGPVNETIHQIDENADVQTLRDLTQVYIKILEKTFL
ncbi:MAG: succinyl-diaminopimelate desuccinylase [Alphaproteobacteria bacterium]|nr:succinyl-diaminopimelate desuccinylase [Alphaproteobacteria bacterium]|tara:strand:+ start:16505 stop:17650 length:1146 start_codon:yes stop_codon:yes gene_type:complete